jgi:hypothetical protein
MKILFTKKSITFALITLMLAQSACRFGIPQPASVAPQPTSGGSQAITQATSPATIAGSSASSSCQSDYLPIKAGAAWTFAGTSVSGSYTQTSTITGVGTDNFQTQAVLTEGNGNQIATPESWNCTPQGLVQLGGPLAATFQSLIGGASVKAFSTTGVTIPVHINPGDSWSQNTQLEITTSNGSVNGTVAYAFQAIGLEQVTVPGGSFNAMKVQVTAKSQSVISGVPVDITADGFDWFAAGVGRVKGSEKVNANGSLVSNVEGELQSYHIP